MQDPKVVRAWTRIFRDFALVICGVFVIVHETVASVADPLKIGAGLILLGLPPALRADTWLRRQEEDAD